MKIDANRIPAEEIVLQEEIPASELDLDTGQIKFHSGLKVRAVVSRITNAVSVDLNLRAQALAECSRCLEEFSIEINRNLKLNYCFDDDSPVIDLVPKIREDIITGYPIKLLCQAGCRGLCPVCGRNLNEGKCCCQN